MCCDAGTKECRSTRSGFSGCEQKLPTAQDNRVHEEPVFVDDAARGQALREADVRQDVLVPAVA
jgi:hypothetical protein